MHLFLGAKESRGDSDSVGVGQAKCELVAVTDFGKRTNENRKHDEGTQDMAEQPQIKIVGECYPPLQMPSL